MHAAEGTHMGARRVAAAAYQDSLKASLVPYKIDDIVAFHTLSGRLYSQHRISLPFFVLLCCYCSFPLLLPCWPWNLTCPLLHVLSTSTALLWSPRQIPHMSIPIIQSKYCPDFIASRIMLSSKNATFLITLPCREPISCKLLQQITVQTLQYIHRCPIGYFCPRSDAVASLKPSYSHWFSSPLYDPHTASSIFKMVCHCWSSFASSQ